MGIDFERMLDDWRDQRIRELEQQNHELRTIVSLMLVGPWTPENVQRAKAAINAKN
jgi:hypothetical protein